MAVTKQTYTATATWTAAQLASIFRSAFIDAGLMTEWFDSFSSSGIENRVLEVIYDGAKTYGKTYYWFKFTTAGVWLSIATGWNATTDQPTGTLNIDHATTTTNATTGHSQYLSAVTSVATTLVRYTSGDAGGQTWFLLRHGSTSSVFQIDKAGITFRPFLDLNKYVHCGFHVAGTVVSGVSARVHFSTAWFLRRSYFFSLLNIGATSAMTVYTVCNAVYVCYRTSGSSSNWLNSISSLGTQDFSPVNSAFQMLPFAQAASNPAFGADKLPIVTGLLYDNVIDAELASDIGVVMHFNNNTMAIQDRFIIEAGVNEWEILAVTNSGGSGSPSPCIAARIT